MTVSEQIIKVLDALCAKFGIVIDWTANNVLPQLEVLCEKFIRFEICTSIFWMVFITILMSVCWITFGATRKQSVKLDYDDSYGVVCVNIAAGVVGLGMSVIFFVVIGVQAYDIVEAVTFPEKTLFEYVSNLMRTR